jgi:GT2 family glycosyltransferase
MPPIQVGAEWGQSDFSLHDVLLRVASLNPVVCHIPLFAVYFREGQRGNRLASDGTCAVSPTLRERLDALYGFGGYLVTETALPGFLSVLPRVRLNQGGKRPSLFVIVPFRDGLELTLACLSSLEAQVHNLEVVVVLLNNASQKNETVEGLAQWQARARHNRYITVDYPGAFNFAKINNVAIAMAIDALGWSPDLVMFLNNDVELTDTRSLETMAAQCLADTRTGFVGMRLLFPDGELQHGGVGEQPVLDMAGYPRIGHNNKPSQFCTVEHECMAVTFAAAMTRFAVYAELGGLDEIFTPNGFGDVDACLRARSLGYRSHYFGTLAGVHNESRTRGVTYEEIEFTSLHDRNAAQLGILRVRQLAEDLQPELVRVAQCTQLIEGNESDLPIRFQIANAIHGVAVRLLGDEAKQRLKPVVRRFLKW